jgi:tryptophan halogenase
MDVPETLARRLELFRAGGRFFRHEDELFADTNWVAVMLGQGIEPRGHDPLVDAQPAEGVRQTLKRMRETILAAAQSMPTHGEFIARHCAARPPADAMAS